MKKKILAGNWKMNLGVAQSRTFIQEVLGIAKASPNTELWVTPSSIALEAVCSACRGSAVRVGAQNVAAAATGAFTGELSVPMLKEIGVSYALVGHSERRNVFGESAVLCAQRAVGALTQGLTVVFCVGELLAEREAGKTLAVIKDQLRPLATAKEWKPDFAKELVIAYEPVWAIGTGKVASLSDISSTLRGIRELWGELFGTIPCPPLLYGGSVDPTNAREILAIPEVDGCLVGGASISKEKLAALAQ